MKLFSNNLAEKEIQQNELKAKIVPFQSMEDKKTTREVRLALSWLRSSVAAPKEFASRLGIGERQVYKWINEEASIPRDRLEEILWIGIFFMIPLLHLREETDRYLLQRYSSKNLPSNVHSLFEGS